MADISNRFDPSRWETPSAAAKDAFMPFGVGPRSRFHMLPLIELHVSPFNTVCIGINLARMELRLCTALFFRKFQTAKLSETADSDMEMVINFLTVPKGHRCLMKV